MNQNELDECFEFVLDLVTKSGDIVRTGIKDTGKVETKTDFYDLVTKYDSQVENVLISGIKEKYPNHCFIGEETSSAEKTVPELTDAPTWIIDPIDGTCNFVKKNQFCCISIALVVQKSIVIGIVYAPISNELYTAQKGKGAFLNGERIYASKQTNIQRSLIAHEVSLGSLASIRHTIIERCRAFVSQSLGIRCYGSAALTLCFVARGLIDAFNVDYLWAWDIAAGALIIQEAGGIVINTNGGEYDIMKPNVITAGTQELCDTILKIVREVDVIVEKLEESKSEKL